MEYSFSLESNPDPETSAWINQRLHEYNRQQSEDDHHQLLAVFVRDETGALAGGLLGGTYWGWLHIDILWVREDSRRSGLGKQMLIKAEAEAVRRGCRHAHVDTHDFQAPDFYLRNGYTIWGVLEDLPPGHKRIYLRKDLM